MAQHGQRPTAMTAACRLRTHPDQAARERQTVSRVADRGRARHGSGGRVDARHAAAELVGHPDSAGADRDRVWPVTDRDRLLHGVRLRVDARDRPVQAVGDPDRAIAHSDRAWPGPDADARGDLVGLGVQRAAPVRLVDPTPTPRRLPTATSVAPATQRDRPRPRCPVTASTRLTVASLLFVTHTAPPPTATPLGPLPTAIVCTTRPAFGVDSRHGPAQRARRPTPRPRPPRSRSGSNSRDRLAHRAARDVDP